jgi:hypothetical protein
MKIRTIFLAVAVFTCFSIFESCKKDKNGSESKTSTYNATESHNVGESCMECHNPGGPNDLWFTLAGTVYKPDGTSLNPNSTVYLYTATAGGGSVILTLPADGKANFYTTGSISFGTGLFPAVKSSSGQIRYMAASVVTGNCNSCHNSSKRIMVN